MIARIHRIQYVLCLQLGGVLKSDRRQIRLKARSCRLRHRFGLEKIQIAVIGIAPCDRQRRGAYLILSRIEQGQQRIDQRICRRVILGKGCGIQLQLIAHDVLHQRRTVGIQNGAAACLDRNHSARYGDLFAADGDSCAVGGGQLQSHQTHGIKSDHGQKQHRQYHITEDAFLARFAARRRRFGFFCGPRLWHGTPSPFCFV